MNDGTNLISDLLIIEIDSISNIPKKCLSDDKPSLFIFTYYNIMNYLTVIIAVQSSGSV